MEQPKVNPANKPDVDTAARKRIPMSIPRRKLEVPDISGYHLHWFLDSNVPLAIQGGYEMVDVKEVPLSQFNIGTDTTLSGNASMGSNIKVVAGTGENGQPAYLNLMKIRLEWWQEDQKLIEDRNASILSAIFTKESIPGSSQSGEGDTSQRYVKTALLQRPTRKGQ